MMMILKSLVLALACAPASAVVCESYDNSENSCTGCVSNGECVYDTDTGKCTTVRDSDNCGGIGITSVGITSIEETPSVEAAAVDWVAAFGADPKTLAAAAGAAVVFSWTGNHDVQEMADAAAFEACDFSGATYLGDATGVEVAGASSGTKYYSCSVGSHCDYGQKVAVTWGETTPAASPTPPPSPAPIPAPSAAPAATYTTAPSAAADAAPTNNHHDTDDHSHDDAATADAGNTRDYGENAVESNGAAARAASLFAFAAAAATLLL